MKAKRWLSAIAALVCLGGTAWSADLRKDENTLVMVPRSDERAVQFGMDLANQYPTLLVTYLVSRDQVSIRGWTGSQWVSITAEDFRKGNFFKRGPTAALVVEPEGEDLPESLMPSETWCPYVARIETSQIRPLIHLTGRFYDFNFKRWQWYSKRYDLPLEAINPDDINVGWYQKRLTDHFKQQDQPRPDDLKYWVVVREPVGSAPVAPVADPVPADTKPAAEQKDENPLTNAVSPAVVMGAGGAPAEVAAEPGTEKTPDSKTTGK